MPIEAQEVGVAAARAAGIPVCLDPHEEYIRGFEPPAGCEAVAAREAIGTFGAFPSDPPGRQARFDRLVALLGDRAEQRLLDAVREQLWMGTAR
jgi:hypothetical protein